MCLEISNVEDVAIRVKLEQNINNTNVKNQVQEGDEITFPNVQRLPALPLTSHDPLKRK
jgi:hypothetical protein